MLGQYGTVYRLRHDACGGSPVVTLDAARYNPDQTRCRRTAAENCRPGFQQCQSLYTGGFLVHEAFVSRSGRDARIHSIGQVRRDTALYDAPTPKRGRGRPRKYGDRYTAARVALLPEHRQRDFLYGKWQWVRYRSTVCLARFLKGRKVRAVWMQFESEEGFLSKSRLPQLLATYCGEQVQPLLGLTPWRKKDQVTAGLVRLGLQLIFGNVRIRSWWNPKWRKFQHPEHGLEDVNLSKPPDCVVSKTNDQEYVVHRFENDWL